MIETYINHADYYFMIISRITMAIILASLLGIERELTGKVAGLRTHILVCTGACVFTILSLWGFRMHITEGLSGVNDPARIGAQIITGIGFIGAGTIMRTGSNVLGITTASTLWMVAGIGMACGCGMFAVATFATITALFVLILIRKFEKKFLYDFLKKYRTVKISISCDVSNVENINKIIDENFKNISKIENRIANDNNFVIKLMVTTRKNLVEINNLFKESGVIEKIDIQEFYE